MTQDEGRPLLVVARNSDGAGRKGCRAAAADAHDAMRELLRVSGWDVTECMPTVDQMAQWLFESPNRQKFTERNGKSFGLRSCLVDLSEIGLVISLSAGSGLKLTKDHLQPHATHVHRVLSSLHPSAAGLFAKRWDRISRSMSVQIINELQAIEQSTGGAWGGDGENGIWDLSDTGLLIAVIRGHHGLTEGRRIRQKSASGSRRETGPRLEGARVQYALCGAAPPGLMRYRDRATGRSYLALDQPQWHPDPHSVITGLPAVRDANGQLVDQVATVRWFLANYGMPGTSDEEIVNGLVSRYYSTDGLRARRHQGPTAYWGGPTRPISSSRPTRWLRVLCEHLDMYETGRLVGLVAPSEGRSDATAEGRTVVIEGVFPTDGPWASPDDFARIRAHVRRQGTRRRTPAPSLSFANFEVSINDVPATLIPNSNQRLPFLSWLASTADGALAVPDEAGTPTAVPRTHRSVPDDVLVAAMVAAVVDADGHPLRRFVTAECGADQAREAATRRDRLAMQATSARRALDAQLEQMNAADESGELLMPTSLRRAAYAAWVRQEQRTELLERELQEAERDVATHATSSTGVSPATMASLLNALRDPAMSAPRSVLRDAVHDLRFRTEPSTVNGYDGTRLHFEGKLVFAVGRDTYTVPFAGSYLHGMAATATPRLLRALSQLRGGISARDSAQGSTQKYSREVADLLGVPRSHFSISSCGDPDLLRLGMAVLFPDAVDGEDPSGVPRLEDMLSDPGLIEQFADVGALAARIREHYTGRPMPRWIRANRGRNEVSFLVAEHLAAPIEVPCHRRDKVTELRTNLVANDRRHMWDFDTRARRPRPHPCAFCHDDGAHSPTTTLALLRIPEVTGYLCLKDDCRRDRAGVRWPHRFDRYIAQPSLWIAAGVALSVPPDFTGNDINDFANAQPRRIVEFAPNRFSRLTAAQKTSIATAYVDSNATLKTIKTQFGISDRTIYDVLREAGITESRRRPKSR